mgnify:CR=1 FL=1
MDFLLNQTHGPFGSFDLIDAANQKFFDEKSDYDLIEMWNDASQKVVTQKLLLVGHSQGNFYVNNFYDLLADRTDGVPRKSLGVYAVATPASRVAGGGNYITSDTDKIINATKAIFSVLPPNTHILFQPSDDKDGHSFSDVYLKYQGAKIVSDIQSSLSQLQSNNIQNIYLPCISSPPVTFKHELETNLLTFVDHPINTTQKAVVTVVNTLYNTSLAVGNKIIKTATSFTKSLTSAVKSLAGKHSATVILSDVETPNLSTSQVDKSPVTNSAIAKSVTSKPATKSSTPPYSVVNNFPIPRDTEATPPYSVVNNFPIIAPEATPPLIPLLNEREDRDGNSNYVHIEISRPNLYPLGTGGGAHPSSSPPSDTTPPVITLLGDNPLTLINVAVSDYAEPGATALDNIDGARVVIVGGLVSTSTPWIFTVTYTATDLSGNTATAVRTVNFIASI